MIIHFNDGSNMSLDYHRGGAGTSQYNIGEIIQKAFEARQMIFEMEDRTVVIPFTSVKYVEITPSLKILPKYAIRQAAFIGK